MENLQDEISDGKKRNIKKEPEVDLLERAYTSTRVPKVMAASAKQKLQANRLSKRSTYT
jgi:dephospho-CoA kinase